MTTVVKTAMLASTTHLVKSKVGMFSRRQLPRFLSTLRPILISIEGNIGAGKSTLILELKRRCKGWNFIEEPVDIWSSIKNEDDESLFTVYYKDPKRWSYSFQTCALLSRFQNIETAMIPFTMKEHLGKIEGCQVFITERCLDTDYHVFAKMLRDQGKMDSLEFGIYSRLYDYLRSSMTIPLTAIIHIDTKPHDCLERIKMRNRTGESELSVIYLQSIEQCQRAWMSSLQKASILHTCSDSTVDNIARIEAFVNSQLVP
jgi:deoxyadenosine/deoxycytidine kinase